MTVSALEKLSSTTKKARFNARLFGIFGYIGIGIIATLTILPILRMGFILATTGANNLSNDHVGSFPVIDQVLNGHYQWKNYFRDTFSQGHSTALTVLVQIGLVYLSHLNVYVMLFIGMGLAAIRLILLYNIFTCFSKSRFEWLLWPILSALIFSSSQISTYEYDYSSIEMGLFQLGLFLGLWGMVRYPGCWLGIALMAVGGIIANWTWAGGPLLWPVYIIGMVLLNFRRIAHYLVLLFLGFISSWPYLDFLLLKPGLGPFHENEKIVSFFNYPLIIQSIGWPFAENFSSSIANARGWVGLILCLIGLGFIWLRREKINITYLAPALLLIIYSLLNIWQVSVFRNGLAPWYAAPFMLFWIGLLALAYNLWLDWYNAPKRTSIFRNVTSLTIPMWCLALIGTLAYFYLTSNLTYSDKSFLLRTRSPASASCLRNYKTAPTYCERALFVWELGEYQLISQLAQALERHHLSVFAPHQRWDLQGDFILNNVRIHQVPGFPNIFWSADLLNQPVPWSDYRHLNLFLHSPNSIDWTINLPPNLKQAEFRSAIAISQSAPHDSNADGVIFEVSALSEGKAPTTLFRQFVEPEQRDWIPFSIPLNQYAGQSVTLHLTSEMRGNNLHDWAMFRYPYIEVILNPMDSKDVIEKEAIRPSNTDLSPLMPRPTVKDFRFDLANSSLWDVNGMKPIQTGIISNDTWIVGEDPFLKFNQPLNICLSDYTNLYVRMSASPNIALRYIQVFLQINNNPGYQDIPEITLLADGQMHEYTYDLKLLGLDQRSRLTGIRLDPVEKGASSGQSFIKLTDFRIIRSDLPTNCPDLKTALSN
jgi:hypothetical protein